MFRLSVGSLARQAKPVGRPDPRAVVDVLAVDPAGKVGGSNPSPVSSRSSRRSAQKFPIHRPGLS